MTDIEKYKIARWAYACGHDFINDNEYNELHQRMLQSEYAEYARTSWSQDVCPADILAKYGYNAWIDNSIKIGGFAESIVSITDETLLNNKLLQKYQEGDIIKLSYKIDGWNIESHYYNGKFISSNTRGRSSDSKDTTSVMGKIVPDTIDILGSVKVTGELSIKNSTWVTYKEQCGGTSQRNSTSTAIATSNAGVLSYMAFDIVSDSKTISNTYLELDRLGFTTPYFEQVKLGPDKSLWLQQVRNTVKSLYDYLQAFDHKTDGIVLESQYDQLALRLWEWSEQDHVSVITGYQETYGRHKTNIVLCIKPVEINGANISHLNVNNLGNIIDYNLDIGNKVVFGMRSAAVPDIDFMKSLKINGG